MTLKPDRITAYGGAGIGDVAVAGEMPVAGIAPVAGQVPILGAVHFVGDLPAAGTVTITGNYECGFFKDPVQPMSLRNNTISAQCIGAGYGLAGAWSAAPLVTPCETIAPIGLYESAWNVPCGIGFGPASLSASNGAGLAVTSRSPIAPTGVFMTSENCYEGPLAVTGAIPFLGAVAVEGALPTLGGGAVNYGCGNGEVAILNEDIAPVGPYGLGPYGYDGLPGPYGFAGPYGCDGLAHGYAGRGYGCGGPFF
nr:chorion class CB protein M5H4-like [Maniola hyperantus]